VSRVLVTGAGGQVGRAAARVHTARGDEVQALDRAGLDVTDRAAVAAAVAAFEPDLVVHAAAWTAVDAAESDERGAFQANAEASAHVAAAARDAGAQLVTFSTDYVFAGDAAEGYVESDPVAPLSAYGRTKLAGEWAARAEHPDGTYIVRTAWIYDEEGANFVRTMLRIARERGAASVVTDQVGSPTYAGHLSEAVAELVDRCPPGTYHLAGSGATSWHGFAAAIFEDAGVACELSATTSDAFPRPARRPACSFLRSERPGAPVLPPWREGLRACLARMDMEVPT
jgi:dTDP-4-dehydrorhamnose reductase